MTSYLITGGTGSFGQAFVKRVLYNCTTSKVIIYSRDELKQFEMSQSFNDDRLRFFLGDVRDESRLRRAFNGVDIVVHAAALKQVPAAEYNPDECIKTNVNGTQNIINAAIDAKVHKILGLSTDKVVHPVSLYGATKLCAEKLLVAANNLSGRDGPRFSVVRYGNFLGSRGSVLQVFKERAEKGLKFPLTDPKMTRFWMDLDDVSAFAFKITTVMLGGEIFVPKLTPAKVVHLAETVVKDPTYEIIGLRQGEKLHEIMLGDEEVEHTVDTGDYFVIESDKPRHSGEKLPLGFRYSSENA
jgi:UDP-N-acetylglucosamine 4,6-dehydratase/5-epimerase